MKRLPRWISGTLTVLSSALFVAILFLWFRSYTIDDCIGASATHGNVVALCNYRGSLRCYLTNGARNGAAVAVGEIPGYDDYYNYWIDHNSQTKGILWFRWGHLVSQKPFIEIRFISTPLWFLLPFTLILPLRHFLANADRRRRPPDTCLSCGYDLRASPERCPECGTLKTKLS